MAVIDYGCLFRLNGKLINKNKDLFLRCSDTGYVCKEAEYFDDYEKKWKTIFIDGNYFVYAGDENFLVVFYKGLFYVIHNNKIICSRWNNPFISETIYFDGLPSIKVEHLDKNLYVESIESLGTWKDYIKENWQDTTGNEKLSELENGHKRYKWFMKALKRNSRWLKHPDKYDKYRTDRWLATWDYNGNHYEVIFGYGIDTNKKVWDNIKYDSYEFTEIEREIIDKWFEDNN